MLLIYIVYFFYVESSAIKRFKVRNKYIKINIIREIFNEKCLMFIRLEWGCSSNIVYNVCKKKFQINIGT